jgi:hypothetical protein
MYLACFFFCGFREYEIHTFQEINFLAIPAISEASGVNYMQNFKRHSSQWLIK